MTWVFGYGSVIWRPGFPYIERCRGILPGYERRFWQGSPDHRGTPESPGRVVTLVPKDGAQCEGVAFLVRPGQVDAVVAELDIRESGGYTRVQRRVKLSDRRHVEAIVYIAAAENPSYLGPAELTEMAEHIKDSEGPSGRNIDYVLNLRDILEAEEIVDLHVRELADALSGSSTH